MFKLSKLIVVCALAVRCTENDEAFTNVKVRMPDTLDIGCLGSYEINPFDTTEKINQVYGANKIKDGHWIRFEFAVNSNADAPARFRREEGYYRKGKKVGFWKYYADDGTVKDSIEYKYDHTEI